MLQSYQGLTVPSFPHSKTEKLHLHSLFNLAYFSHTELCLLLQNNLPYISTPTLSSDQRWFWPGVLFPTVYRRHVENQCKTQGKCRAIHSLIHPPSLLPFLVVRQVVTLAGSPCFYTFTSSIVVTQYRAHVLED